MSLKQVCLVSSLFLWAAVLVGPSQFLQGSSHREAPAITLDPTADNTDVYAFVSYEPGRQGWVTLISNFIPLQDPAAGPNFHLFDPAAIYEILIDNDGDALEDITFQFLFRTEVLNGSTFLTSTGPIDSLDSPNFNVRQTYTVIRYEGSRRANVPRRVLAADLPVPPPNIGPASTPNYEALATAAVHDLPGGSRVFAGPRDEGFYVDLGGVFDLLQVGISPVDGTAGKNIHSIALEIPIEELTADASRPESPDDPAAVIGVWSTASRPTFGLLPPAGGSRVAIPLFGFANLTQVSRLGNPLVNEAVIPLASKDRFNASHPRNDAQFGEFVLDPELAQLLNGLFGVPVPAAPRDDLVAVFLTGVAGLNRPPNVRAAEMMRLNVAIPPTSPEAQNRLGVLAGDLAGFPNGRRVGDDTVDIALQAVAGILVDGTGAGLGDGVDQNDVPYLNEFPYLAAPHAGRVTPEPLAFGFRCEVCPANWAELSPDFEACRAGQAQTPVNISTLAAVPAALPEITFNYAPTSLEVENLRTTVEAIVDEGSVELEGVEYELIQFHFHTPSEHFVDGNETPIEMHLVHRFAPDSLLVVGVFIVEGEEHEELARIFDDLPQQEGDHFDLEEFELLSLLPESRSTYRYDGSLTTPPCREGVQWILMAEPIELSAAQIGALAAIFSPANGFPDGNRRPIQSLNGRTIVTDVGIDP